MLPTFKTITKCSFTTSSKPGTETHQMAFVKWPVAKELITLLCSFAADIWALRILRDASLHSLWHGTRYASWWRSPGETGGWAQRRRHPWCSPMGPDVQSKSRPMFNLKSSGVLTASWASLFLGWLRGQFLVLLGIISLGFSCSLTPILYPSRSERWSQGWGELKNGS